MATLNELKRLLSKNAPPCHASFTPPNDYEYQEGFDLVSQDLGRKTYEGFIVPQLSLLLTSLIQSTSNISILEVGPGPESVLSALPLNLRRKITTYVAYEPNGLFAARLTEGLGDGIGACPLPCLKTRVVVRQMPFPPSPITLEKDNKYDLILFAHSMYGMKSKRAVIETALGMLAEDTQDAMAVVFHRDGSLHLDGLVSHRTASFPTGLVRVKKDEKELDCFARFIGGLPPGSDTTEARKICRTAGRDEGTHLCFSAPNIMAAFTRHATALPELKVKVPSMSGDVAIKNRHARTLRPACIMRPETVLHVQQCIQWALYHRLNLTVIGGGHSGQCLQPHVVAVNMEAFNQVEILTSPESHEALVVVGAGCKSGEIISKTIAAGLTVPLGSRPTVGAGLWLQGGIGHLSRRHGLACDAIVGAVLVGAVSGQVLYVGRVPEQHRPPGAVRPDNDDDADLLWSLKGAGTNFGIVVSVVFEAYPAPTYAIHSWVIPLHNQDHAKDQLNQFDSVNLPPETAADAYLYWEGGELRFGISMCILSRESLHEPMHSSVQGMGQVFGPPGKSQTVDGVGLFDTEMYMSGMHGGHGGGKTSAFKRCVFLKHITHRVATELIDAVKTRPSARCYLHLLHGGEGRVVASESSAFGCRDWKFACVVTGVWDRKEDGAAEARAATQWVYDVVQRCLALTECTGAYGADLGPDPRDAPLASRAFGPNLTRLVRLKHRHDPNNVLPYACPLRQVSLCSKLIVLVTGDCGAGKDFCANQWASFINTKWNVSARVTSISTSFKREYAAETGASLERLLEDRAYKEQHRQSMKTRYAEQVQRRPQMPEEHFSAAVRSAGEVDVVFVTGMRDDDPVASFGHLLPDCRLLEVNVRAAEETRLARRQLPTTADDNVSEVLDWYWTNSNQRPDLVFWNEATGRSDAENFANVHLGPFVEPEGPLQRLRNLVRSVPDFPLRGIEFRDVLDIAQQKGGLELCTSLLESHFAGDWSKVETIASCEAGGFVFAAALALRTDKSLAHIRNGDKVPPPKISRTKPRSNVSRVARSRGVEGLKVSHPARGQGEVETIAIGGNVIRRGARVVLVDDVLATGETLHAALELLVEAGANADEISVMVVAEFPLHRGRQMLRKDFKGVRIQSLLVFDGA